MDENHISGGIFETELGFVGLAVRRETVVRTTLPEIDEFMASLCMQETDLGPDTDDYEEFLESVTDMIVSYCAGDPVDLTSLSVDYSRVSDFTRKVREACRTIPRGEVRTYRWLAEQAGNPNASRAAGRAMATNPVPLLVPCHRVVGSDGKLTGFGGSRGVRLKERLLRMESGVTD